MLLNVGVSIIHLDKMFILGGSNNHSGDTTNAPFFVLGTGKPCHGALLAIVGVEGSQSVTIPLPQYQGNVVTLSTQGLPLRKLEAIEIAGYRYQQATGELQPGEFFWDVGRGIILVKLLPR